MVNSRGSEVQNADDEAVLNKSCNYNICNNSPSQGGDTFLISGCCNDYESHPNDGKEDADVVNDNDYNKKVCILMMVRVIVMILMVIMMMIPVAVISIIIKKNNDNTNYKQNIINKNTPTQNQTQKYTTTRYTDRYTIHTPFASYDVHLTSGWFY